MPGRTNIIVTRDWAYSAEGARVYSQVGAAVAVARAIAQRDAQPEFFVIGGAEVYAACLPLADRIYLTDVDATPEGDAVFDELDPADWRQVDETVHKADAVNDHDFVIRTLQRVD